MSDRNKAFDLQQRLQENGISDQTLLDFLINNWMTGADALEAMQAAVREFIGDEEEDEDEEEVNGSAWRESEDMFDEDEVFESYADSKEKVFKWFDAHNLTLKEVEDFDYLSNILSNYEEEFGQFGIDTTIQLINQYQIYFIKKVASH